MRTRHVLLCAVIAAAVLAGRSRSEASCNIIPTAPPQPSPSCANSDLVAGAKGLQFPFKAALGRIDRVYLSPGRAFAVAADGIAIGPDGERTLVPPKESGKPTAAFVFTRGDEVHVDVLDRDLQGKLADAKDRLGFRLLDRGDARAVLSLAAAGSDTAFLVPFPSLKDPRLAELRGGREPLDVRIVVLRADDTVDSVETFNGLARRDCAHSAAELAKRGGLVCVDRLYRLVENVAAAEANSAAQAQAAGDASHYTVDRMLCSVLPIPANSKNDFHALCEDEPGIQNAACSKPRGVAPLQYWKDGCGGVHILFDWTQARGGKRRVVAGASGARRGKSPHPEGIRLPGREFVGSTPEKAADCNTEDVNWRLPDVDLWSASGFGNEFGLWGTTDQDDSIIHVYPRAYVDQFCNQGRTEACLGVSKRIDGTVNRCACEESYGVGCSCFEGTEAQARFFVCSSGAYKDRPCTRAKHCRDSGGGDHRCDAKPRCYEKGSFWRQIPPPVGTTHDCETDADCEQKDLTKPQCGLLLFDASDRTPPLDEAIQASSKDERGVCAGGQPCGKGGTDQLPQCEDGSTCRGYRLVGKDLLE